MSRTSLPAGVPPSPYSAPLCAQSGALYGLGGTPAGNEVLDTLFAAALDAMYEVAPSGRDG